MPVTDISTDAETLTMNLTADFAAPLDRLWEAFTNPRQLERFWGPPGWPASFTDFDFTVGGTAKYHMTGPKAEHAGGLWEFVAINEPNSFEVIDSFADEAGNPMEDMPSLRMVFTFSETPEGSRVESVSHFDSVEALEQVVAMGVVEGSRMAINQLDRVLQDLREWAQGKGTNLELLDDTHIRITRLVNGPRDLVWRAHFETELVKQWMLGPDGWEMTEHIQGTEPGSTHRTSWAPVGDTEGEAFGFEGEVLLIDAPRRAVTTEKMQGTDGPYVVNDLQLYEEHGATLVTVLIEYPDLATRDMIIGTGMVDGMEASYARLDATVLA